MKCLSVRQPFADLIVRGVKRIELRSWNTGFRGEFLVHAPQKVLHHDAKRLQMDGPFVTGAVLGTARLFDVRTYGSMAECSTDGNLHMASEKFHSCRYGFMLEDAKKFETPIPCRGRLGFFESGLEP